MGISGFLAGLARTAGAAAPYAANAMAARNVAKAQGAQQNQALQLKLMALQQQQRRQDALDQLSRAQSSFYGARAQDLLHPKPKVVMGVDGLESYDPNNPASMTAIGPRKQLPPTPGTDPYYKMIDRTESIKAAHRPPPQATIAVLPGTDGVAQGVVTHGPGLGHTMALPDVNKAAGAGGGAREGVQIQVAANQALNADQQMLQYEDDLLSGKDHINEAKATLAHRAFAGGVDAQVAEGQLNRWDPALGRYIRNAKAMSVAERLITPRGGSNFLTNAETALAGIGPGLSGDDLARGIAQVRQYRAALREGLRAHAGAGNNAAPGGPRGAKAPQAGGSKDYGIFGNP